MKVYDVWMFDGNEDWTKETLDFLATDAPSLRAELENMGESVAHFKTTVAYAAALGSGRYPWLASL